MSKKPRIFASCPAGCLWETVHKSDFLSACTLLEYYPNEDGKWYLEKGRQYKIFSENVADVGYGFSIIFKYSENGTEKTYSFTIPHEDKYANYVVFKLLEASIDTDLTLVYEIAGVRYTETISGTSLSLVEENCLYIENADKVYIYNDDASYHIEGEQGPAGPTGAKIVSTTLIGQDNNGGNIYEQTFDDGTTAQFTAPRGMKGETGQNGAGCYVNGVAADVNFTSDPQTQINNIWQTTYHINSIYISANSQSPSSIFGGTWEQIAKGRALFGAGEIEPNGSVPSEDSTTKITYNVGEVNAGLPNIQGWGLRGGQDGWTPDGENNAFKLTASGQSNGNSGNYGGNYSFDASWSNELYGKSTTVQPNAFVVYIWKRIA